jgi:hypothetical protein
LVNGNKQISHGSFHVFINGILYWRGMQDGFKDPASLAARCKQMAEKAAEDKRGYWLKMEQFWLSKIGPSKAAAVDAVEV